MGLSAEVDWAADSARIAWDRGDLREESGEVGDGTQEVDGEVGGGEEVSLGVDIDGGG